MKSKNSGTIFITGSSGLIGTALSRRLRDNGNEIVEFDLARSSTENICDYEAVLSSAQNCRGIINLAAVSRVVWAEENPTLCWETNADGVKNVVDAAQKLKSTPWLISASSREVYGEQSSLPVKDDCELAPVNIYGRAKAEGENHVQRAITENLVASIVRFSNVYGTTTDHADRVVPAFARASATGSSIEIHGSENTFDFTHLSDTVDGIIRVVDSLDRTNKSLPPLHFLTGVPTTLGQLSGMASQYSKFDVKTTVTPSRSYDVSRFYGDWTKANQLLGWRPQISIEDGLKALISDFEIENTSDDVKQPDGRVTATEGQLGR